MPDFEPGAVVRVPFPYTDRETRQRRPALVVARWVGDGGRLLWVMMITSAENRGWPGDVAIGADYRAAGLPAPSIVRTAKIATIEASHAESVGRISAGLLADVDKALASALAEGR